MHEKVAYRETHSYSYDIKFDFTHLENHLKPSIHYLLDQKLLEKNGPYSIHLTHSGYHYWQTTVTAFLWFLMKSVAVPIVVAAATTLVTLWLQGVFTAGQ